MQLSSKKPAAIATRNLVVVRAGDHSLHGSWLAGAAEGAFDLIVSYFGDDNRRYSDPIENTVRYKGGKWDGIHQLFSEQPGLMDDYDYVWLPDDDLEATGEDVAKIFALAHLHRLLVCQPALTHDSFYSHMVYLQCQRFDLRFTNAVEIMAPCLAAPVLKLILPFLRQRRTGFGLDGLWTRLFADNYGRSAILDAVTVRHTRPIGGALHQSGKALGLASADQERNSLYRDLNMNLDGIIVYAGLFSNGTMTRSRLSISIVQLISLQIARRRAVQTKYWWHEIRRLIFRQLFRRLDMAKIDIAVLAPAP